MKPKSVAKLAVDILMTLALLFVMGYQFWGEAPHELVGTGMFLLFIIHHILNRHWYKKIFKGRYNTQRVLTLCIGFLLLVSMLAQIYSAVVMSRYVFDFLPFSGNMSLARRLHILGAYWGFLLMSLHLGIHWNMILGLFRKTARIKKNTKTRSIILFIIGAVIACYGICAFIRRDFLTYLLLQSEFVFLDYSEPEFMFYIDYIALMGLCIFIAHYSTKLIRKIRKNGENQNGFSNFK